MADKIRGIKNVAEEWIEEIEKMKKVNFFPYSYLTVEKNKGVRETIKTEDCSSDSHCGRC